MAFLRWPICLVAGLIFTFISYLLAPLVALFANVSGWLPWWLWWFQTEDNSCDGDTGFKTEHAPFLGSQTGWKRYINRMFWLWRNPGYGFDKSVLGIVPCGTLRSQGNPLTSDQGQAGYYWARYDNCFLFYWVYRYSTNRCLRIRAGWKVDAPLPAQFCFNFQPWKLFTGK